MSMEYRKEYADLFRLKRRVITQVRRLVRPLLLDVGSKQEEYSFNRPLKLRNALGGWLADNEDNTFLLKAVSSQSATICNEDDHDWAKDVCWDQVPLEDLIRVENLIRSRIANGFDVPVKVPKLKSPPVTAADNIHGESMEIVTPAGVDNKTITMIGRWRGVGFFWFKREDVRLCAKHARPFQPLQPALRCHEFGDVPARCPWCPGGELAPYWTRYKNTAARLALMQQLNNLLTDKERKAS